MPAGAKADIYRNFEEDLTSVTSTFAALLDAPTTRPTFFSIEGRFGGQTVDGGQPFYGVAVYTESTELGVRMFSKVDMSNEDIFYRKKQLLPQGEWLHFRVVLDTTRSNVEVAVANEQGDPIATLEHGFAPPVIRPPHYVRKVGLSEVSDGAARVRIDDVACTPTPP
jgi:hypothetical protein